MKKIKNKIKIEKYDFFNILRKYLFFIIPTILIYLSINNYVADIQIDKVKEIIIGEQKQSINTINYIINTKFEEIKEDLFIIRNSDEMTSYVDNHTSTSLEEARQLIYRIASRKKNFYKVRFIDLDGKEVIKVWNIDGETILDQTSNMEYKGNRYYFDETKVLDEGDVYVSVMDLNMENNSIEIPYRPVVRVSTPVYRHGNFIGILIINYQGQELLEIFNENFENSEFSFVEHVLINKEGYYLYHANEDKTFRFMFENMEQYSLKNSYPKLWEDMSMSLSGEFDDEDYIYYFRKIHPLEHLKNDTGYEWTIVTRFNIDSLPLVDQFIFWGMKFSDIFILLGISILIFIMVTIHYFRNKDFEQLNMVTMIVENTNDATMITDKHTHIVFVNKAFEKTTGYSRDEILGKKANFFKSGMQSADFYKNMWKTINTEGYWVGELWDRKKDGVFYPKKLSILAMTKNNEVDKYLGVFTDLSTTDSQEITVNKLQNYSLDVNFPSQKLLKKLFQPSLGDKKSKIAVISFSIINYNDLIIRSAKNTDLSIKKLIKNLQEKESDNILLAQLSRNVFIMGISEIENIDEINRHVYNLLDASENISLKNEEIYLQVKAGISIYPKDGNTSEEIINNANLALEYIANDPDKNFVYYDKIVRDNLDKEVNIKILLRRAIENEEFSLNFQPQVDLRNHHVIGAEALLRWNSRELGSVSPAQFIPIAENIGMIKEIGYWVIENAFKNFNEFKDMVNSNFRLSMNISPIQFKDENIIDMFMYLAEKYEVNLSSIEIEITENIFAKDINIINEKMKRFNKLGISIAIDDFGTGFSSLSYLKKLAIDKIKIDRSFIKDYPDRDDGVLANVMSNMSKQLNLEIIAEGVEKIEQIAYLKSIDCFQIQGYFYSKPLPLGEFINYLEKYDGKA